MGLLAMQQNKRHPLPYAIGFALMAVVEYFKWNAFKAPVYSSWESPDVSLFYFAACVAGALFNLYDTLFVPATNRKERNPSLRDVVQNVAETAKEALHSAEATVASLKGKEELHSEWNQGASATASGGKGSGAGAGKARAGQHGRPQGGKQQHPVALEEEPMHRRTPVEDVHGQELENL